MLADSFVEVAQAVAWVTFLMCCLLYICSIELVRTIAGLQATRPLCLIKSSGQSGMAASNVNAHAVELMSTPGLRPYHSKIIIGSFGMVALLTGFMTDTSFRTIRSGCR